MERPIIVMGEGMDYKSKLSLLEGFGRYFSVTLADSTDQKREVYQIRYRVYCEEFAYESVDNFPDQLEMDEYDDYSTHCLITHLKSGKSAGCVRLVPAIGPRDDLPLPFEKYCSASLDQNFIDRLNINRDTVCEISRLAVDGVFRRRNGETQSRFGEVNAISLEEERTFPLLAVAGFLSATVLTEKTNRTNVFAMMEPFLPRLMHRSGIEFVKVGSDIDYHGLRALYFIKTESVLNNMRGDLRELYQCIRANMLG